MSEIEEAAERVRAFVAAYTSMPSLDREVHSVGVKGEFYGITVDDLKALVLAVNPTADVSPMDRRGLDVKTPDIDWAKAHKAEAASITRGRSR